MIDQIEDSELLADYLEVMEKKAAGKHQDFFILGNDEIIARAKASLEYP